jgi:hypothetical protein
VALVVLYRRIGVPPKALRKRLPEKLSMFGEEDRREASPGDKPEQLNHEGHHQRR